MRSPSDHARTALLAAALTAGAAVWLIALPKAARHPATAAAIDRVERAGVDPGAVFYTDHPRAWESPRYDRR